MRTHALNKLLARNISGWVLIIGFGGTSPALAQSSRKAQSAHVSNAERANARTHALAAFDALDSAKFEQAVQEFGLALELIEAPTLRVGRAQALTKLGRWIEAASDYEAALRYTVLPSDAPSFADSQKTAASKLAELRAKTPVLVIQTGDSTAQVTIDDYAWKPVRSGEEIAVDPGAHRVVVTAFGQTVTHRVDAAAGAQINLQGPVQPESGAPGPAAVESTEVASSDTAETESDTVPLPPPPDSVDSGEGGSDTRLRVSAVATGVLVVGAVVTGFMYWNARSGYDESRKDPAASDSERQEKYDDTKTMAWVNTGLAAAAVVGAGVTTYFWLSPSSKEQAVGRTDGPRSGTSAGFSRPDGFTIGLGGTF